MTAHLSTAASPLLRLLALAILFAAGTFLSASAGNAQQGVGESIHHRFNLLGESIGAAGYDPVAYFPEGGGKPQKGLIKYTFSLNGVTYRFASEDDLNRFKQNPAKYTPVYGGWCAWAVGAIAKRVDVDPESFVIHDGKLYLFYRDAELDTRALWLKDREGLLKKAEQNWPALQK